MRVLTSINGVCVKPPTDFGVERYSLTKSGRALSGKIFIELVAKKRKFTCAWDIMSGPQLDQLILAADSDTMVFPLVYVENGVTITKQVYSGAIKYRKFRSEGVWYWKNITCDFIEE